MFNKYFIINTRAFLIIKIYTLSGIIFLSIARIIYTNCVIYNIPVTINCGLYVAGLNVQYRRSLKRGLKNGTYMFGGDWRLRGICTCTDNIMLKNQSRARYS